MRKLHNRLYIFQFALIFLTSLLLYGCASNNGYNSQPWNPQQGTEPKAAQTPSDLSGNATKQAITRSTNVKIAILLPLSGQHAKLGNAMLNSAQMALFDIGFDNFELLPKDTKGTPDGAKKAAQSAINNGAELVLGPVFSSSVKAARQITQKANINMIAFSTDWTLANNSTFLIGFLPFNQVERVVNFAVHSGYKNIGVISPRDAYGESVVSAYKAISQKAGVRTSRMTSFQAGGHDLNNTIRKFSDYDARNASHNAHGAPFDAVFMPMGGALASQTGRLLNQYNLPAHKVKRLGTGLMDDKLLARDRSLEGAWFAAPDPQTRNKFERKYHNIYFSKPPRIASLSYDATALAITLAQIGYSNNTDTFNSRAITNANGFFGVDGIFRFRKDGIVERGLAVLEYRNGSIIAIDKAPTTFQNHSF